MTAVTSPTDKDRINSATDDAFSTAFDIDGDGDISDYEQSFFDSLDNKSRNKDGYNQLFNLIDGDRDGNISDNEYNEKNNVLFLLDRDGDKKFDQYELDIGSAFSNIDGQAGFSGEEQNIFAVYVSQNPLDNNATPDEIQSFVQSAQDFAKNYTLEVTDAGGNGGEDVNS